MDFQSKPFVWSPSWLPWFNELVLYYDVIDESLSNKFAEMTKRRTKSCLLISITSLSRIGGYPGLIKLSWSWKNVHFGWVKFRCNQLYPFLAPRFCSKNESCNKIKKTWKSCWKPIFGVLSACSSTLKRTGDLWKPIYYSFLFSLYPKVTLILQKSKLNWNIIIIWFSIDSSDELLTVIIFIGHCRLPLPWQRVHWGFILKSRVKNCWHGCGLNPQT